MLSGSNTFTGGAEVEGGTLEVLDTDALYHGTGLTVRRQRDGRDRAPSGAGAPCRGIIACGFARGRGCVGSRAGHVRALGGCGSAGRGSVAEAESPEYRVLSTEY